MSKEGVYTLRLAKYKHYIVPLPSLAKDVFGQRSTKATNDDFILWVSKTLLGDDTLGSMPDLMHKTHLMLNPMLAPQTLAEQSSRLVGNVVQTMGNLVSFTTDSAKQETWERSANIVIPEGKQDGPIVEASLFELVTRWVGSCVNPVIMGQAFVDQNPSLLDDLFTFNEQMPMLLSGLPPLNSAMKLARAAQKRLIAAVADWDDALYNVMMGRHPGPGWGDMKDVSEVMRTRHRVWREEMGGKRTTAAVGQHFGLLWGTHTNSNIMFFWLLTHLYADPSLLAKIRKEIAPHVTIRANNNEPSSSSFSIDHVSLSRYCPLLKSTFYEVMRYDLVNTAFKTVIEDFAITESVEDAVRLRGRSATPRSYLLKKGNVVCVANDPMQTDSRIWSGPDRFEPERFLEPDPSDEKQVRANMQGRIFTFGGGTSMCKGRLLAEKEMLICAAAVLTLWDIELVPNKFARIGPDGKSWIIQKGTDVGAAHVKGPVRVTIKKRQI